MTALTISNQGAIRTITLNRPDVRNAFNDEVIAELKAAFIDAGQAADVRCVVVLNLKVPRRWEAAKNNILAVHTPTFPNATLIDWHGEGEAHGDWFYQDGIHLNAVGRNAYATLIAAITPTCGK